MPLENELRVRGCIVAWLTACVVLTFGAAVSTASAAQVGDKANAVAFVRAVNLRAHDLPTWRRLPDPAIYGGRASDGTFDRCAGVKPYRYIASATSPTFGRGRRGAELFASEAIIAPSAKLVSDELAALQTEGGRACFSAPVRSESEGVTLRWLPFPIPSAQGIDVRIEETSGPKRHLYIDLLVFRRASAMIFLLGVRIGAPPNDRVER